MNVKNSFLGFRDIGVEGACASNLFSILKSVLQNYNFDLKCMVGFGSDGASNMRGDMNGLCALIRNDVPDLIDYYCALHRFNLVMRDSLKSFISLENTKDLLLDISVYINRSSNKIAAFHHIQTQENTERRVLEILEPVDIRWSSTYSTIHSIVNRFSSVKRFFEEDSKNENTEKSIRFSELFNDNDFIRNTVVIKNVKCRTTPKHLFFDLFAPQNLKILLPLKPTPKP
jgi:hypothetical protein